jgi:hypothetical protein
VEDAVRAKWHDAQLGLENLATSITAAAIAANADWPMFTMPYFEKRADEIMELSEAIAIGWAPKVLEETRAEYEKHAEQNQGWIAEGIAYSQDSYYKEQPALPSQVHYIPELIHRTDADLGETTVNGPGPFLPVAQLAPVPSDPLVVNYDILSDPVTNRLFTSMEASMGTAFSGLLSSQFLFLNEPEPHTLLMHPILAGFDKKDPTPQDLAGVAFGVIHWSHRFQNLLPPDSPRVDVVVKNTCGDTFTYQVKGSEAVFVGHDAHYDRKYNDMVKRAVLEDVFAKQNSTTLDGFSCEYEIYIYPSSDLEEEYKSIRPVLYACMVALLFVFIGMVFLVYDGAYAVLILMFGVTRSAFGKQLTVLFLFYLWQSMPKNAKTRLWPRQLDRMRLLNRCFRRMSGTAFLRMLKTKSM